MTRIMLTISYDGAAYHGWQVQPTKITVQGKLEDAIKKLTGQEVSILGGGRTDAGVHAVSQTATFDLLKDFSLSAIVKGLNFYLDEDIRVLSAQIVPADFHVIKAAVSKTYAYRFYFAQTENPLLRGRALQLTCGELSLMRAAAGMFIGTHDFAAFMSRGSGVKTTVRTVSECYISDIDGLFGCEHALIITANGFLYNMVRKIMGLILAIGRGKSDICDITDYFTPGAFCKELAPPYALYLLGAKY